MMKIEAFPLTESHRNDLEILLFQLSGKKRTLHLHTTPNCFHIGAFCNDHLVGFAQLFILQKTTFSIAHLEDLIVHCDYRETGLGKSLIETAINTARVEDATVLTLTSRKERTSAWSLFGTLNFKKVDTQVFRLEL